jgi:hypothetical protein
VQIISKEEGWIGHRLNILGIRVWNDKCQLVAKVGEDWITLGPSRSLPLEVPADQDELINVASDPLLLTAYQYIAENPDCDLAALLSKKKDFDIALNG